MIREKDFMNWWREAKFGMFIHWGIYSALAGSWNGKSCGMLGAEWIMRNFRIPLKEYRRIADSFNPTEFDAEEYAKFAADNGMKYMVFTAKHHDGFAMYKSKASSYNIVDATPFGRDIVKELAEACKKYNVKFCVYYSQYQDWEDPNANGNDWDYNEADKDFKIYFENKLIPQVNELLTQYGDIGLIWFDTPYDMPREYCEQLVEYVKSIQPNCIINGRVGYYLGDYKQMSDNSIPVLSYPGDWETPFTINNTWGYDKNDTDWKDPKTIMEMLVKINSRGGNLLLNVGPDELGRIPERSAEIIQVIGRWLKINGESIYGTTCAPDFPYMMAWGGFTRKSNKLYMHNLKWPVYPYIRHFGGLKTKINRAYFLADGSEVEFIQNYEPARDEYNVRVKLPEKPLCELNTVVVLELDGEPEIHQLKI